MALQPIPAAAQPLPDTLTLAEAKQEKKRRAADSRKIHEKIRREAEKHVVVWNYKPTEASNLPYDSSASAPVSIIKQAAPELKSHRAELFRKLTNVKEVQSEKGEVVSLTQDVSQKYLELQVDPVGSGTYGKVMQGKDLVSGSLVAIKRHANMRRYYKAAVNETNILQELNRRQVPHCLHLRDAFDKPGPKGSKERVIVTDLIPGKNVYEMHKYFTSYPPILSLGRQLLEYCLSPDFLHADLAPSNLMYEPDCDHLTVLDCGLSEMAPFKIPNLIQKSFYRCPEVILNGPIDSSADIWSIGCILFELLTGSVLFKVFDDKKDMATSSAKLLQKMATQIGMPTPEFLKKCSESSKFYRIKGSKVHLKNHVPFKDVPWREAVLAAAPSRGLLPEQAFEFIRLLEGMLSYENRPSAHKLLQSPLFQIGISFHLAPTFAVGDIITIYRAWDMDRHLENPVVVPAPSPVFQLQQDHVRRTCHHLPVRDFYDRYVVYVQRQGISYSGQLWQIHDGQELGFHFPAEQPFIRQATAEVSSFGAVAL